MPIEEAKNADRAIGLYPTTREQERSLAVVPGAFGIITSCGSHAVDEMQNTNTTHAAPVPSVLRPVSQTRYAPASQISTANAGKLEPVFIFQTAVMESMETALIGSKRRDVPYRFL
jgi:hypothetical protein